MYKRHPEHIYLSILVILGLISSGLGPLCVLKFSTKQQLEICTVSGIQIIEIDSPDTGGQLPSSPDKQKSPGKSCGYCFATHMAKVTADLKMQNFTSAERKQAYAFLYESTHTLSILTESYSPRAPPYTA